MKKRITLLLTVGLLSSAVFAQNPIIRDQFTADPTARVFEGKVYVYPSHDIPSPVEHLKTWFCMADYHVFSSENLTDWTDHGVIVSQDNIPWVNPEGYSLWAPDCIERNGKYYFYFPAPVKDTLVGRGMMTGVAVADKPYGPFVPQPEPIKGTYGIDPCTLIDKDGQAYIYWAGFGGLLGAKLADNMLELASEPVIIQELPAPDKGMKEGPFVFERNGKYYFTFPWVKNNTTELLAYAMGDSPLGPFEMKGEIMDESSTGCWTNHHSIVEYKGQWYLFYHHNDLSPKFDKNRSIRIDSLRFNPDGTIQKVIPTLRGVGITDAYKEIQIDRYSKISSTGVRIDYIDTTDTFKGWKTILNENSAYVQYNSVNFGNDKLKTVKVNASSSTGAKLQIHTGGQNGTLIAEVNIPKNAQWSETIYNLSNVPTGIQDLFIMQDGAGAVEIDWIRFEQ
ncbi:MAG: family 43 glycosylhydrolase [Prevotellaceae bacterium]|jgi:GH43 family beta-xylosidase|nr:family 43 glycosylhydrolase [Prevotellaceae bacterium]